MLVASLNSVLANNFHRPLNQIVAIIVGTFILEDATTILAALSCDNGQISSHLALGALYAGVILGDLGLYGLGRLSQRTGILSSWISKKTALKAGKFIGDRIFIVVFASRFLPGARLPTYTSCGFFQVPFLRFALPCVVATLIWTSLLFAFSRSLEGVILSHSPQWQWGGVIGILLSTFFVSRLLNRANSKSHD